MHLFGRKKFFLYIFYLTVIVGFVSIRYIKPNQLYQFSSSTQSSILTNSDQTLDVLFSHEDENRCINKTNPSRRNLGNLIHRDHVFNYLGFVLRSHSLFYCSVPKVATRTLLTVLTYLHIRDELIPSFQNKPRPNILNIKTFNQTILTLMKNDSQAPTSDSISLLQFFLSQLLLVNSSKIDLWSMYGKNIFPFIRLRTLSDPSILFSSGYLRVILVRHPFERLASAYVDKISSLNNQPLSTYDNIRRAICRKYSLFYLTHAQRVSYNIHKGLTKKKDEPCQKIVPTFEHFIEYFLSDSIRGDVHWKPYSSLCHVCTLKYNFIGKFETIEEDLSRLTTYLGLESKDWINENYFKSGKTREYYKSMFSNLSQELICCLKYFYKNDFELFNYRVEDYLTNNKTIQCSTKHLRKILKTKRL